VGVARVRSDADTGPSHREERPTAEPVERERDPTSNGVFPLVPRGRSARRTASATEVRGLRRNRASGRIGSSKRVGIGSPSDARQGEGGAHRGGLPAFPSPHRSAEGPARRKSPSVLGTRSAGRRMERDRTMRSPLSCFSPRVDGDRVLISVRVSIEDNGPRSPARDAIASLASAAPGRLGQSVSGSDLVATTASVVRNKAAIEAAF
jgi:hypothetical protein